MTITREEERRLIRRAAGGDQDAAARCIQLHQRSLYAYLLRMCGKPDVAEDISQEAFVRVLTNLDRFDERFRFSTWLFTIARRLYLNYRQKLRPAYDSDMVAGARDVRGSFEAAPAFSDEIGRASDKLGEALLQLSEEQREIVVLFHQLDWSIALIASHLGMPEGTVKSHLHRGRKRLRALMAGDADLADRVREVRS